MLALVEGRCSKPAKLALFEGGGTVTLADEQLERGTHST
jgi:hypothetical protein